MSSINQLNLFGYEKLFKNLVQQNDNNNLPNKIIISVLRGIGKTTFSYHLINYLFSKNEEFKYDLENYRINQRSSNLIYDHSTNIIDDFVWGITLRRTR